MLHIVDEIPRVSEAMTSGTENRLPCEWLLASFGLRLLRELACHEQTRVAYMKHDVVNNYN